MDELKQFLRDNPTMSLIFPAMIAFVQFVGEVVYAVQDGSFTLGEYKAIIASASGIETAVLLCLMFVFRRKK